MNYSYEIFNPSLHQRPEYAEVQCGTIEGLPCRALPREAYFQKGEFPIHRTKPGYCHHLYSHEHRELFQLLFRFDLFVCSFISDIVSIIIIKPLLATSFHWYSTRNWSSISTRFEYLYIAPCRTFHQTEMDFSPFLSRYYHFLAHCWRWIQLVRFEVRWCVDLLQEPKVILQ